MLDTQTGASEAARATVSVTPGNGSPIADLPAETGIVIVGAGTAGIAAGLALAQAGIDHVILEARDRIGGRAFAREIEGEMIDVGAHWFHCAGANPVARKARGLGFALAHAPYHFGAFANGREMGFMTKRALIRAWQRAEDRISAAGEAAYYAGDRSARDAAGDVGPWTDAAVFLHGAYDCGSDLRDVSSLDFSRIFDDEDEICPESLGAVLHRLAQPLAVTLNCPVTRIRRDEGGTDGGLAVETPRGTIRARAVIVTVSVMALQTGIIAFEPALPSAHRQALERFGKATYEHALIHLEEPPWGDKRDRILLSIADRPFRGDTGFANLFGSINGTSLHYVEMCGPDGLAWLELTPQDRAEHVLGLIAHHFGAGIAERTRVLMVSDWGNDPYARGSWSMLGAGKTGARVAMRQPVPGGLFFAGEATSHDQWGTVGGAWVEGERAATEAMRRVSAAPV